MNIPTLDDRTGKVIPTKMKEQMPKYKCPKCGRGVRVQLLPGTYSNLIKQREEEAAAAKEREQAEQDGWVPSAISSEAKKIIEESRRRSHEKKNQRT
jgi:hypothetical protein